MEVLVLLVEGCCCGMGERCSFWKKGGIVDGGEGRVCCYSRDDGGGGGVAVGV